MTVTAQNPVNSSTANGVTTVFPYTFKITDETDLKVIVDGVEVVSGFTVSGVGNEGGGNVTFSVAPANGLSVVRIRDMTITRDTDYQEGGDLLAETLDSDIDRAFLVMQQINEAVGRAYKQTEGTPPAPVFPEIVATQYLRGTSDGLGLEFAAPAAWAAPSGSDVVGFVQDGSGAANRTVQDKLRESVSIKDFGAYGLGAGDDSAAAQLATNTGKPVFFPAGRYKISGVAYTGKVIWFSNGDATILSDGVVLTVTDGPETCISNLRLENITVPYVVTRDYNAWATTGVVSQTNDIADHSIAYQPTANDYFDGVWAALSPAQQAQNIGPQILIYTSDNSVVEKIKGEFVSVRIHNSSYSTIRNCNFRAGKNFAGGIVFWNAESRGTGNSAEFNTVRNASFSGITFCANDEGQAIGNKVIGCGESGIKTEQNGSNRCSGMLIQNNRTKWAAYDGFDFSCDYPHTGTYASKMHLHGNRTYGNRRVGFYGDGMYSKIESNYADLCGLSGYEMTINDCTLSNNVAYDCNQLGDGSVNHFQIIGSGNKVEDNFIIRGSGLGYAIYAPENNVVRDNFSPDGVIFLGNNGSVTSVTEGNISLGSGEKTQQSFQLVFLNNGGTISHLIKQESITGGYGALASRVAGSTSSLTPTPNGADASTAFATGVKIGGTTPSKVYLDTGTQSIAYTEAIAVIDVNQSGTPLTVALGVESININGTTKPRVTLEFRNGTTGDLFDISSANIAPGKAVGVKVLGSFA